MYNQFVARLITEKLFNLNSCHTHNQVLQRCNMSREFGWITPTTLKENAPDGANLWLDLCDQDLVHEIIYFKQDKEKGLLFYLEHYKTWEICTNLEWISKVRLLDDDGRGSLAFSYGDKVVFLDKESIPQIWTVSNYLANGNFSLESNGPKLEGVTLPANKNEIRKATQKEIEVNSRL